MRIIYELFLLILLCLIIVLFSGKISKLTKQRDYAIKQVPYWEMVVENCGRDEKKDLENTYCRGFKNGFDYSTEMDKIDEQLIKMQEEFNN